VSVASKVLIFYYWIIICFINYFELVKEESKTTALILK